MSRRIVISAFFLLAAFSGEMCRGQRLQMGMDGVAWENNNDQGPLLFRNVSEANLTSVRAKISAQTAGNWSQSGVIVRAPNPIDAAAGQENWQTSWSFRPDGGVFTHQSNAVTLGTEAELNTGGLTAADLTYVRLDNMGGGSFQAYRGSGPDDNNITWTPHAGGAQTNANLSGITLQVGIAAGAIGALPNASVIYDWVEIVTTTQTFRDDFNYTHDFTSGVPVGGIWNGVENAAAGGVNTTAGPGLGECTLCTWGTNGSGNFNDAANWSPALVPPNGNTVTAVFGAASAAGPATVYTNTNVTLKALQFNNANMYALGGPGSITLDADAGNALIDVLAGSHQIQADVILSDNVTATAAAGTTLNINAGVFLNGRTFTVGGGGTINLNNGQFASVAGGGSVVNDGNLAGLASVAGDYTQTAGGSLAIAVGDAAVQIAGAAEIGGVLDVSLADGFVPVAGNLYTVLTADSVTDVGLSLSGADGGRFKLVVGGNSVSLLAAAIPEPTTIALAVFSLVAGATLRTRRRLRCVQRLAFKQPGPELKTNTIATCFTLGVFLILLGASTAQAQFGTFRDDFGGAVPHAAQHDYTTGTVPAGGIWTGIHNPTNGGDAGTPAFFVADGFDFQGITKEGKLFIEDLNLHLNEDGATLGIGWEGNKNNAPFLYRQIPANSNFTATMKIDAQTAGNWSYSPIIARLAGNTVGHGIGGTLEADESFVTMGTFRTDAANPGNASMLTQNVVNLGETEANPGGVNGLPIWIRVVKTGSQFTSFSSVDGTAFTQQTQVVNAELNTAGEMLEVGPSFMMFTGGSGAVEYDFFEITVEAQNDPMFAQWTPPAGTGGSGTWNAPGNWTSDVPGTIPNHNTIEVIFGPSITTPSTVFNDAAVMVKKMTFNNANKYAISGTGVVTMQAAVGGSPSIEVQQGSHEVQVAMALGGNTTLTAAAGTRLDFNNQFDFVVLNRSLTITGGGKVNFNNNINLAINGVVNVNSTGNFGGTGRVNGTLNNNAGGTVSPGASAGTLTVEGNYVQNAAATLAIELGGTAANAFDKLAVGGLAQLNNGTLNVSLIGGFVPLPTDTFQILTATGNLFNLTRFGNTPSNILTTPAGTFNVTYTYGANGNVTLSNFMAAAGVPGDYNDNNVVDAADYAVWRDKLNQSVTIPNDTTPGTVTQADYNVWRANFGKTSPGSGSSLGGTTVPEPGCAALLLMGIAAGAGVVRRTRQVGR